MATHVQVVIDCADPAKLGDFWIQALRYKVQDPPQGFASWPDFLRANKVPESEWNSANALVDPDGAGPRVFFQRVPEPKTVKNRVHLDLNVSGGLAVPIETRKERIAEEAKRLEGLGASQLREVADWSGYCLVMQDPEGNEFCLQ
jgi:hypothetical protein